MVGLFIADKICNSDRNGKLVRLLFHLENYLKISSIIWSAALFALQCPYSCRWSLSFLAVSGIQSLAIIENMGFCPLIPKGGFIV